MSMGEFLKRRRGMLTIASVAFSCLTVGFYAGLRTGNASSYEMRYYPDGAVLGMGPAPIEGQARWGTTWYATGETWMQIELEGPQMTGRSRSWDTEGHLIQESFKADANGLSAFRTYLASGHLFAEGFQRNGKDEGRVVYHDPSGALIGENNYVDGKLDGLHKEYYPSGEVKTITRFSHGERVSAPQYFDEQGNPVSTEEWNRKEEEASRVWKEKRKAASKPSSRPIH